MSVQVLAAREVPLGGQRAITVRRTLPHKDRSFVGAWCFVDHYGPEDLRAGGRGMDVAPHPHTGLQTVSWLFDGHVQHRDSDGVVAMVRPGEMNLMTSGYGIAHSEVSTDETTVLHGVQLWVALPEESRNTSRTFEHYVPQAKSLGDGAASVLVFIGELPDVDTSPVTTHTPLLGVQVELQPFADLELNVNPEFEHAVLVDEGSVTFEGQRLERADLGCLDPGRQTLHISTGQTPSRVLLLGGTPFEEEIVMWWNFIGRTHDDIAEAREEYEAGSERFGHVEGYEGQRDRIPAPPLPKVRLLPRNRRGKSS